jgi:hypothetical protein
MEIERFAGHNDEPASDADAAVVDSLKALDPNRPIREADSCTAAINGGLGIGIA